MGRASPLFITVDSPSSPWASEAGASPAASIGTPTADENEDEEEEEDVEVEEEEKKEEEGEEDLHPPAEEKQQQVKKTISSRRRNRRQRYIKLLKEEGHYIKPDVERRRKKRRRSSSTSSGSSNGNDIQGHSRTISIDSSSISSTSSPTIIPEEEEEKAVEREVKLLAGKKDIFGAGPLDALMHGTLSIKGKVQKLVEKHICSYAGHEASSNYQHDGVLGEGTFAPVVVVGKRGGYGNQELALKMIKLVEKNASKAEQDKAVRRAVLEAEALYLLRGQKGTIQMVGLALWEDNLVLALELAEGGTLERWRGQLNEMEVMYVASQLMEAQQSLERAGVIHCDIKLANILLKLKEGAGEEGEKEHHGLCSDFRGF